MPYIDVIMFPLVSADSTTTAALTVVSMVAGYDMPGRAPPTAIQSVLTAAPSVYTMALSDDLEQETEEEVVSTEEMLGRGSPRRHVHGQWAHRTMVIFETMPGASMDFESVTLPPYATGPDSHTLFHWLCRFVYCTSTLYCSGTEVGYERTHTKGDVSNS